MRSFIKKLAGAMAFTMVVSSVAPAGAVFAADGDNYLALQGGDTRVEDNFTIALRSNPANQTPVDFRFVGAPDTWKNGVIWTSTNPAVATVDENGKVTALAEGKTMIIVSLKDGSWDASAWINVVKTPNNPEEGVYIAAQNTISALDSIKVSNKANKEGVDLWYLNGSGKAEWVSSDESIATVSSAGLVKGVVDANGIATVSLYLDGAFAASIEVVVGTPEVYEPVVVEDAADITVSKRVDSEDGYSYDSLVADENGEYTVTVGETFTLDHTTIEGAEDYRYDYGSSWVWNSEGLTEEGEEVLTWIDWNYDFNNAAVDAVCNYVGTTTVSFEVENEVGDVFKATPIVINVVEAETPVDYTYEINPVSDKDIEIVFADERAAAAVLEAGKDGVELVKVRGEKGTSAVKVKAIAAKKDVANTLVLTTYVAFANGDNYRLTIAEEDVDFVVEFDKVDGMEITFASMEDDVVMKDGNGVAYANEDGEIVVKLSTKIFSGNVDVTKATGYSVDNISYELKEDNEDVLLSENELIFEKANIGVVVVVTYTGEDENGEEYTYVDEIEIVSEAAPAYEIVELVDWTFAAATGEIDWKKTVKELRAEDDAYIVALLKDNYGNTLITDSGRGGDYAFINNFEKFYEAGYELELSSSDVSKMILDGNKVEAFQKTDDIGILFTLVKTDDETDKEIRDEFEYVGFVVKEARKFDKIQVSTGKITLPTEGDFTNGEVKFTLVDQTGTKWTPSVSDAKEITVKANNDKVATKGEGKDIDTTFDVSSGEVVIEFLGKELKNAIDSTTTKDITVVFTVQYGGKNATVEVVLDTPRNNKTTYGVTATGANQTLASDADSTKVKSTVEVLKYIDKIKIQKEEPTLIASADALSVLTKKETILDGKKIEEGAQFLVVYYPDGTIVPEAATSTAIGVVKTGAATSTSFEVVVTETKAASDGSLIMKYAPTGTYKAELITVTKVTEKKITTSSKVVEFVVENKNAQVTVDQKKVVSDAGSDVEIILDAVSFKLGTSDWEVEEDDIVDYDVISTDDYLVIKSITVRVQAGPEALNAYYEVTIDKVMTVQKAE